MIVQVARQNGKSEFSKLLALFKLFVDDVPLVLGVAQDLSIAKEVWEGALAIASDSSDFRPFLTKPRFANGEQFFGIRGGGRYKISAATRSAGRGLSVDHLTLDEIREHRTFDAWSALSKTTNARPNAQVWAISNAGDRFSVVLNQLRDSALAGKDPSLGLFEWSAPDGCALDDPEAWAQANPAMGYLVTEEAIRSALAVDPPDVFRTEVLCQRVDVLDAAVDPSAWASLADPQMNLEDVRDSVVLGLDVAPDGLHATLVAAGCREGQLPRLEVVEAWSNTEDLRRELPALVARIKPRAFAWLPAGPAAALAPMLRELPGSVEIKGSAVGEACQGLADLVANRGLVHPGDPLLDAHVTNTQKFHSGDSWRFVRKGVGHVDAAYAAAAAVYALFTEPEPVKMPRPMIVF
ncbi:terminase [Amycolatopsis sp. NPDC051903]|uniref:terminase n=1 Tax=Amycolatopsis sp. NPDC051903 TaxID=3363936 RepID=UPI00379CFC30